jgi:hypothetical protein
MDFHIPYQLPTITIPSQIPKIFVQCSRELIIKENIQQISKWIDLKSWIYYSFTDETIISYFIQNPLVEFPNIVEKFNSFIKGPHKADLFRYYFLYLNGGVYIDSDVMIYKNIDEIINPDTTFFTVNSAGFPGSCFQGILGCSKKNPIIYDALCNCYNVDNNTLDMNYHYFCKYLYQTIIIEDNSQEIITRIINPKYNKEKIQIFREHRDITDITVDKIIDNNNNIIFRHFHYYHNIDLSILP